MHKKLVRPSLLDDDSDDEISNFGKNSNRFLKSNNLKDKPKEEFRKDTSSHPSSIRSITPRSVDTDSDLGIDDNDENESLENFKNSHTMSKKNEFSTEFKTPIKKSPRSSLSNDKVSDGNDNLTQPNIVKISDRFSKSPRETNNEAQPESNPRAKRRENTDIRSNKDNKENKFSGENSDENDDLFTHKNNSLSKTLKFSESEKVSKILDTINKKPEDKSQLTKLKFALDEDEEEQDNDIFKKSRNNNMKILDENDKIEGKSNSNKSKDKKMQFLYDDDNESFDNKYLKTSKNSEIRLLEDDDDKSESKKYPKKPRRNRSKLFDDDDNAETNNNLKKSKNSRLSLFDDDDYEEDKRESNKYLKTNKVKLQDDEESQDNKYLKKSKPNTLKSLDGGDEIDINDKRKSDLFEELKYNLYTRKTTKKEDSNTIKTETGRRSNNYENKFDLDENELIGSTRYIRDDSRKQSKKYDLHDDELNNSTKLINISQTNDSHSSPKSDIKPKPRKSHFLKLQLEDEEPVSHRDNKSSSNDDIKRRSIRFDDQIHEHSNNTSRDSSPRKSILSRQNSNRSSPSPPTSICEEVVQDPVTLKLKNLKNKQEESRRENEWKHESLQSRIINDSISAVADSQHENESKMTQSSRLSNSRPVSSKYKNVPPRVTTRINIKSMKGTSLNDEWSSTPNLYSGQENTLSDRTPLNSQSIRDTAYLQWYLSKLSEKNHKKQSNEIEEPKKKPSNDEERERNYQSWLKEKQTYFEELTRKKKEEKKKNEESKVVKDTKVADMAFEVWKKKKEEVLKKEASEKSKRKKEKELALLKEQEERKNKKSELVTEWKSKKAKEIHDKKIQMLKEEHLRKEEEINKKKKLYEAEKAYQEWEEKADKKEKQYSEFEKNKVDLINNRRAWRPSSTAIIKVRRI